MVDPRQCEVFLQDPDEIFKFIEDHEKEGSGMAEEFVKWIQGVLEQKEKEGKFGWPALFELFGPHELYIVDGPRANQMTTVYEVRYITGPNVDISTEESKKQIEMHNLAFVVVDGELVEVVIELHPS